MSVSCAHALEERRESLRVMVPQWLLVRLLAQQKPETEETVQCTQALLYAVEELRGRRALMLKVARYAVEALLPTAAVGFMLLVMSVADLEL
ncbi:unnamed protein product, partial [Symbiodinium pilosum]